MIPDSSLLPHTRDWKIVLSEAFRQVDDLLTFCQLSHEDLSLLKDSPFPLRVTRYYASLIEKGNPADPLLLQILPLMQEQQLVDGFTRDAVGDHQSMPLPGLIHKYHGRVLLTVTGACAIHCRYCFRRHFPYQSAHSDLAIDSPVLDYLRQHADIHEVILSGGDPLMLSDQKLSQLIRQLNSISHIRLLRIHSRLLSVLPERINEVLIKSLKGFNGQVVIVTHINHPNEISEHNQQIFRHLKQKGFSLFNQSVLLKQVNDDADTLAALSYRLFDSGITPYYLHRLDKVEGTAHFDLPKHQSCEIYHELRARLPGYLLPSMVQEIAGQASKSPVHCS